MALRPMPQEARELRLVTSVRQSNCEPSISCEPDLTPTAGHPPEEVSAAFSWARRIAIAVVLALSAIRMLAR
jgi:hypothetical protein